MTPPNDPQRVHAVRRPALVGVHTIYGVWWPARWFDEDQRQQRIVQHWLPGARAWRFTDGDLLTFAQAVTSTAIQSGWPLIRIGPALSSALLDEAEASSLPKADVWIIEGGEVQPLQLARAQALNPASWIDLSICTLLQPWDLRGQRAEPALSTPIAPEDLRAVLGNKVAPPDAKQRAFLAAMQQRAQQGKTTTASTARASSGGPRLTHPARTVLLWFVVIVVVISMLSASESNHTNPAIFFWLVVPLAALLRSGGTKAQQTAAGSRQAAQASGKPGQKGTRGLLGSIKRRAAPIVPQRWRAWLARAAVTTELSRVLGWRQAAYVRRMMQMFEDGELDAALRHAIPLGGTQSQGQSFGTPQARQDLSLKTGQSAAVSLNFGAGLDQHLRQLYRRTFEKLDREGRIEEAVFVLAELLQARAEALDYLEKHQRFNQAAQLAYGWDMPAATIVRMYCLAGDWRYALAIARRDNAWASALTQLEAKWPDAARQLRKAWADDLVEQGHWLKAVEVAWPLEQQRETTLQWLLMAESAGEQLQARALLMRATLIPDTVARYAGTLSQLRDDPEAFRARDTLVYAALALKQSNAQIAAILRTVLPSVLADRSAGRSRIDKSAINALVKLSADRQLAVDLPSTAIPVRSINPLLKALTPVHWEAPAAGLREIHDAIVLDDGRFLLALGEAGVIVIDDTGKTRQRFAVPAQRIITGASGQQVLLLTKRELPWRVSKLDLVNKMVTSMGSIQFDHCADQFDGRGWAVARGDQVQMLDVSRSLNDVLWQVTDLPGPVLALNAASTVEQLVVQEAPGASYWRYQQPERRLLERAMLSEIEPDERLFLIGNSPLLLARTERQESGQITLHYRFPRHGNQRRKIELEEPASEQGVVSLQGMNDWFVGWQINAAPTYSFFHVNVGDGRVKAILTWPRGTGARMRVSEAGWLVFDFHGRLTYVDIETGEPLHIPVN